MNCFFKHNWGAWKSQAAVLSLYGGGFEIQMHQERSCSKCGKIEQEKLYNLPLGHEIKLKKTITFDDFKPFNCTGTTANGIWFGKKKAK